MYNGNAVLVDDLNMILRTLNKTRPSRIYDPKPMNVGLAFNFRKISNSFFFFLFCVLQTNPK